MPRLEEVPGSPSIRGTKGMLSPKCPLEINKDHQSENPSGQESQPPCTCVWQRRMQAEEGELGGFIPSQPCSCGGFGHGQAGRELLEARHPT